MNKSASRMTFGVTWVVERIVATHFLNPVDGIASGVSAATARGIDLDPSICCRRLEFSNQKRQVILRDMLELYYDQGCRLSSPQQRAAADLLEGC